MLLVETPWPWISSFTGKLKVLNGGFQLPLPEASSPKSTTSSTQSGREAVAVVVSDWLLALLSARQVLVVSSAVVATVILRNATLPTSKGWTAVSGTRICGRTLEHVCDAADLLVLAKRRFALWVRSYVSRGTEVCSE